MIEWIKIVASIMTPLTILVIGILINKKLEKNKIEFLKQKEWQIYWAEKFITTAHELNTNISHLICTLFELQNAPELEQTELNAKYKTYHKIISVNEWELRNYVQFAEKSRNEVIDNLDSILNGLTEIVKTKQGNIEPIRQKQFDFNKAVRNAHAEILNIQNVHNKAYQ